MNRNRLLLYLLIPLLWIGTCLSALDPDRAITQYRIHAWDMESGLPANAVYAICQTRDGYLWIGTQDGLVRFDGLNFEIFNRAQIPQLEGNIIRALYQARNGILWIGTLSGGLTRLKHGRFTTWRSKEYETLDKISAIGEDRQGILWIGSIDSGLTCFQNGRFTNFTKKNGLPDNRITRFQQDKNRDLWVVSANGIVKVQSPGIFELLGDYNRLNYFHTDFLSEEESRERWIGTGSKGLLRMKDNNFNSYGSGDGIPHPIITSLYEDRAGNLWIGTEGGGLTRRNRSRFSTLSSKDGLNDDSVSVIYEDNEDNLWVGTLDGGLHQLMDTRFITYTIKEGLAHNNILCTYEDRAGNLWAGTKGGLCRLKEGRWSTVLTTASGLVGNNVAALNEDRSGNLWIGTWSGLQKFKAGKLNSYSQKEGLADHRITAIFTDRQGTVYVGTHNGLNRFNSKLDRFTPLTDKDGLVGQTVQFIFQDSHGNLLVGTNATLNLVQQNEIIPYFRHFSSYNGTGPDAALQINNIRGSTTGNPGMGFVVRCAYEDEERTLWLGTDSGLIRCRENTIQRFTVQNGLNENNISSILEDDHGYFWLAGQNGISRIPKKELEPGTQAGEKPGKPIQLHPRTFNEHDGMKSRWVTNTACRTRDNKYWFPTSVGLTMLEPANIKAKNSSIPVIIEDFLVDGNRINLDLQIRSPEPIPVAQGKRDIEFNYTAASFIKPREITFKTWLDGYDQQWVQRGKLRTATYTHLPPGHYTFNVMACNPNGVWSKKTASVTFYLKPWFYQTSLFYIVLLVMALISLYLGYRLRVRQLQNKAIELSKLVAQRTSALEIQKNQLEDAHQKLKHTKELIESKNLQLENQSEQLTQLDKAKSRFFANISHEFRTPLTLIIGPLEEILAENHNKKMNSRAQLMMRSARRLLNMVNQLLGLAKFESGKLKLQLAQHNIVPFLKGIVQCFQSLAQQKKIELFINCEESDIFLYYDQENLERIMGNLLANAFNYTPPGGRILVSLQSIPPTADFSCGCVEISVKDTGAGIPGDQLPHIFDRFYQGRGNHGYIRKGTGIGLSLTKELVELHHGGIDVRSSCAPHGTGTCFLIRLPLGTSHLSTAEAACLTSPDPCQPIRQTVSPVVSEETWPAGPAPRVLVVEDDSDVRSFIKNSLEPRFGIIEAADGKQGIQAARETIPDLIICDILIPEPDGYQVCKTLKTDISTSHIPIVFLSSKVAQADILEGLACGADDFITKPFNAKILSARANNLIDLRTQLQIKRKNQMELQPHEIPVLPIDEAFYNEFNAYIETHLADPHLSVRQLAKEMGIGRTSLNKKIQAITGESPNQFIRHYRLKRAAQLLTSHRDTIAQVATQVGFSDFSYFSRCFKERFQLLPSHFREDQQDQILQQQSSPLEPGGTGSLLTPTASGKEVVLVIEDNEDARQYIRESLEPQYTVETAPDGEAGIECAFSVMPDLIVSDIMMPKVDGYQLCRTLKKDCRTSHIPIILLTAKVSDESVIFGLETGADDYIAKPFNRDILRVRIKNLVNLRRQMQVNRKRQMVSLPDGLKTSEIDREFYRELQKVIEKHLDEPEYSIQDLSKELYMGRTTLYRKVLALTGETPSDFIRSYRLKRAAQLMRRKFGSVLEVALEVGFSSSSYFAKCFRQKFHQSPSEYLESH